MNLNLRNFLPSLSMSPIAKSLLFSSGAIFSILVLASYKGMLPLGLPDFFFLLVLSILAAAYRPGWMFLLLVTILPLETVNLAPVTFGTDIRPYQFLVLAIYAGLAVRFVSGRSFPAWPKPHAGDVFLSLIPIGALVAVVNAPDHMLSFRMAIILFSFLALYVLFRMYIRTAEDVGRILPFVVLATVLVISLSIFQNALFLYGNRSYEVMPGRPNGSFPEADWLGVFLVFSYAAFLAAGYMISSRSSSFEQSFRMKRSTFLFLGLVGVLTALTISVSRSAWLGAAIAVVIAIILTILAKRFRVCGFIFVTSVAAQFVAIMIITSVPLTDFDLSGRANSVGTGQQTITISCERGTLPPTGVSTTDELAAFGCRHINLDEIPFEMTSGYVIAEIQRNDPNISIRKAIYDRSIALGSEHPFIGVGWGSITRVLGTDARGAGLNASNVFLEIWLGSGLFGIVGFVGFLVLLAYRAFRDFRRFRGTFPFFLITAFSGLIMFDLFNSGILLGFVWAILGVSGSYLFREASFSETL
ncbi:MAG: hypothetical protein HGB34_01500 [Candidatus Moranbacteria bacterium]|nr:hypothetical protein [Candidatus Moranbacteria bacterium]